MTSKLIKSQSSETLFVDEMVANDENSITTHRQQSRETKQAKDVESKVLEILPQPLSSHQSVVAENSNQSTISLEKKLIHWKHKCVFITGQYAVKMDKK